MLKKFDNGVDYSNTMNSISNNDSSNSSVNDSSRHRWAQAHKMMWMPNAECPPTTSLLGSDSEEHEDEARQGYNLQEEKEMENEATLSEAEEKVKTRKPESTSSVLLSSLSSTAENVKNDKLRFSSSAIVLPHGHLTQVEETPLLQEHVSAHTKTPTKTSNHAHSLLNKLSNQVLMACYNYSSCSSPSCTPKGNAHKPLLSNALLSELKEVLDDEATETYVKNLITAVIALSESVHDEHVLAANSAVEEHKELGFQSTSSGKSSPKEPLQKQEQKEHYNAEVVKAFEARDELELILEEMCKRLGCKTDLLNWHRMEDKKSYKQVYCNLVGLIEECTQRVSEIKRMYCYENSITTNNNNLNSDSKHEDSHLRIDENKVSITSCDKLQKTASEEKEEKHEFTLQSNKGASLWETLQETYELIACHSASTNAISARATQNTLSEMADILENYEAVLHSTNMPSVLLRVVNELEQLRRSRQFDEVLVKEYEHSVHDRFAAYGELYPPCVCDEVKRLVHVQNNSEQHKTTHHAAAAAAVVHDHDISSLSQAPQKTQKSIWLEQPLQELLHDISRLSSSMESLPSMEQLLLLSSSPSSSIDSSPLLFVPHNAEQTQFNVRHAIELAREQLGQWKEESKQHENKFMCTVTTVNDNVCKEDEIDALNEVHCNNNQTNTNSTYCKHELTNKEELIKREQVLALNTIHELINTIPLSLQIKLNLRSSDSFTHTQAHTLKDVVQSLIHEHLTQEKAINVIGEVIHSLQKTLQVLKVEQGTFNQVENKLMMIASSLLPVNSNSTELVVKTTETNLTNTQCSTESAMTHHRPLYAPLMSSIHELEKISNELTKQIDSHLEHLHDGVYTASQAEVKDAVHKLAEMLVMENGNLIGGVNNTNSNNKKLWPSTQTLVEPPSHKLSDMIALVHACWLETLQASQRQQLQLMHVNAEKARIQRSASKYTTEMSYIMNEMCSTFAKITQTNDKNSNNLSSEPANATAEIEKGMEETVLLNETLGQQQSAKNVTSNGVVSSPHSSYGSSEHLSTSESASSLMLLHSNESAALSDNVTSSQAEEHLRMLTERLKMLKVKSTRAVEQLCTSRTRVESLINNTNTTQRRMRKVAASLHNICHTLSIPMDNNHLSSNNSKGNADVSVISEVEMIRVLRLVELRVKGNGTIQESSQREGKITELQREIEQCRNSRIISTATLRAILNKLQTDGQLIKSALYLIGTDESANDDLLDEIQQFLQTNKDPNSNSNNKKNQVNRVQDAKVNKRKPDFDVSVFSETSSEDETKHVMTENKHNTITTSAESDEKVEELLAMLMQKYTRWTERLREGIDEHLYTQQKITRYVGAMCRFISSAASQSLNVPSRQSTKMLNMDVSKLTNLVDIDDVLMQYADNVLPELDRMLSMSERRKINKKSSTENKRETENVLDKLLRSTKTTPQEEKEEELLVKESEELGLPPVPLNASNRSHQSQTTNNINDDDEEDDDVEDVSEEVSPGDYVTFSTSDILPYDIRLEKLHERMIKLHTILSSLHRVHYLAIPVAERVRRSGDVELIFEDSEDVNDISSIYDKFVDVGDDNTISGGEREKDMRTSGSQNRKSSRSSVNTNNEKVGFVNIDLAELVQSSTIREMKRREFDKTTACLQKRKPDKFAREYSPLLHSYSFTTSDGNLGGNERNAQIDSNVHPQKDESNNNKDNDDDFVDDNSDKLTRLMNNEVILNVLTHNAECLYNSAKKFSSMYKSAAIIIQKDTDAVQSLLSSMLERYSELDVERAFQQNRNELLAMYSVLSEKGTKAKGCYFFTRVNGDGPCVWTAALEKLNAGFGPIIDKLVERTELVSRYRSVIDHVSSNCLEYVNWSLTSQLPELQLPASITEKCSSTENINNDNSSNNMEANHVNDGSKVEKTTDSARSNNNNNATHEKEIELLNALPPMPTEMPTLTPLEKLLVESTTVQLTENNVENNTINANAKDDKSEVKNENVKTKSGKDDDSDKTDSKKKDIVETVEITHFTEDEVLASVVRTLFDQLKIFVAHYHSHNVSDKTSNNLASLQEELQIMTRQIQTLEDERDKALSSAAVARTELRRWLRQNGLGEEITEKEKSSVQPVNRTNNNGSNANNSDDELQVMLSPPTEITPVMEPHTISLSHTLNDPLASMHINKESTPPVQLEAIRQYLCALNAQLQFAETAIGKHRKINITSTTQSSNPNPVASSSSSTLHERHWDSKANRNESEGESNQRKSVAYESDTSSNSDSSNNEYMEPATTSANMVHAKDMDLVVTPSPHRYAIQHNLRHEPHTWKHNTKEDRSNSSTTKKQNSTQERCSMHNSNKKNIQEQERQIRSVSSTRLQRERQNSLSHSPDNYNRWSNRSTRANQSRSRSSTARVHDNVHNRQEEMNVNERNERQKARAVRHQIEKNRHFPPSHKEEEKEKEKEKYEKQHEYNVRSLTPKRSVESHSHTFTSNANRINKIGNNNNDNNECSTTAMRSKDSKLVSGINSNNLSYFKLTPSETRRLLRQSHTRSPNNEKYKTTSLSMSKPKEQQQEQQQRRSVRKESVNKKENYGSTHNESNVHVEDHNNHRHVHRHRHNSNAKRQQEPQQLRFDDYTNSIGPDLFEDCRLCYNKLSYESNDQDLEYYLDDLC